MLTWSKGSGRKWPKPSPSLVPSHTQWRIAIMPFGLALSGWWESLRHADDVPPARAFRSESGLWSEPLAATVNEAGDHALDLLLPPEVAFGESEEEGRFG